MGALSLVMKKKIKFFENVLKPLLRSPTCVGSSSSLCLCVPHPHSSVSQFVSNREEEALSETFFVEKNNIEASSATLAAKADG